jgi:hypothetical protein
LLGGYRGAAPGDIEALATAMVALSRLALDLADMIESIDINPVLVQQSGIWALDGLVVLRPPEASAAHVHHK